MDKYKKILSNTLIFAVGTFASKLLVFLLMPLYTSILSAEQYGVADLITQTANLLIPIACIGICDGIFRFAIDSEDKKSVFSTTLCIVFAGSAVLVALSPVLLVGGYFKGYVWLICAYVICANFHSACAQYIKACNRSVLFAWQGIINTALTIVYNILFLVFFKMGVTGYVLSVVLADLTVTLYLFFKKGLYRDFSFSYFSKKNARAMLKFSIPYIPTTLLWMVTSISDRFIVTYFCGDFENGLYAAAYKIPTLLTLICGVFIGAWQISAVSDGGDDEERKEFFSNVYKNYLSIMLAGAAFIMVGAKLFTKVLLADSYYTSWEYIPILVIATVFSSLVSFLGSIYFLEKKSIYSMLTALSGAVVNIILNFVMIPAHGAMGAAVATMISYMTVYVIRLIDTSRYLRFETYNKKLLINVGFLLCEALVLCCRIKYSNYIAIAFFLAVVLLNLKGLIAVLIKFFNDFLKKNKK